MARIAVMVLTLAAFFPGCGPQTEMVNQAAPPLAVQALLQAPPQARANWQALQGQVVILEFWATWCPPCVASIPHLNDLAQRYRDRPLKIIAITMEDRQTVERFVPKHPIDAWIALDQNQATFRAYGVETIPHTVIVDSKGMIRSVTYPAEIDEKLLEQLLAEAKIGGEPAATQPATMPASGEP